MPLILDRKRNLQSRVCLNSRIYECCRHVFCSVGFVSNYLSTAYFDFLFAILSRVVNLSMSGRYEVGLISFVKTTTNILLDMPTTYFMHPCHLYVNIIKRIYLDWSAYRTYCFEMEQNAARVFILPRVSKMLLFYFCALNSFVTKYTDKYVGTEWTLLFQHIDKYIFWARHNNINC